MNPKLTGSKNKTRKTAVEKFCVTRNFAGWKYIYDDRVESVSVPRPRIKAMRVVR